MQKKAVLIIVIFICALVALLGGNYYNFFKIRRIQKVYFWNGNNFEEKPFALKQKQYSFGNNLSYENYILKDGSLAVVEDKRIVWQSPEDWQIDSFILADSNNNGVMDINLSLWKPGNFGSSKPFWTEGNDMSVKNHFFILDFVDGAVKQVWGSSNLSQPNCEFKIADVDNDGNNELVVIEGIYERNQSCSGKYVAVWKWNGWGFSNEWRSEEGNFTNLEIGKKDGNNYILVDSFY